MFVFSSGMMVFFMLGGALRSAGDARTPMVLGVAMTLLNIVLNVMLIRGLGPIPAFGTKGAAMGTCIASGLVAIYSLCKLWHGGWVVSFPRGTRLRPGLDDHPLALPVRPADGHSGHRDEHRRRADARRSSARSRRARRRRRRSPSRTRSSSRSSRGRRSGSWARRRRSPDRTSAPASRIARTQAVHVAARYRRRRARRSSALLFLFFPRQLLGDLRHARAGRSSRSASQLLRVLSVSGLFIAVALTYTGGLQGTGDTKSPLYISIVSQVIVPLGICFVIKQTSARSSRSTSGSRSSSATRRGAR